MSITIWNLLIDGDEDMKPLEIHKDKGWITNIVPILKPICLFGLKTKIRDTTKIPFLTAEGDKKSFEKSKKQFDVDQIDEFLLPTEKLDLHKLAEGSKNAYIFRNDKRWIWLYLFKVLRKKLRADGGWLLEHDVKQKAIYEDSRRVSIQRAINHLQIKLRIQRRAKRSSS